MSEPETFDALLQQLPDDTTVSEPAADVAATESAAKLAELDAVVPADAADIDEAFRGKPVSEVLRIATQHKHQIGLAQTKAQEANALRERLRMAEATMEFMRQQSTAAAQPRQPEETEEQWVNRLQSRPRPVISEVAQQYVAPVAERLEQTEQRLTNVLGDLAQERARTVVGLDESQWSEVRPAIAALMWANNLPVDDPNAWAWAAQRHVEFAQRLSKPAVEVPRPAPPPGGAARSQTTPSAKARLKPREQEFANEFLDSFGIKPGTKAYDDFIQFAATEGSNR